MQLHISEETEAAIQARAESAGFRSAEEYILELVNGDLPIDSTISESRQEWLRRFNAFVARQQRWNSNIDDSRESIYPVR